MRWPGSAELTVLAGIGLAASARPRLLRWGSTGDESTMTLPGDSLLARADLSATRAITISAACPDVWPWLAQLGQGRGGFYSYDRLENLVGCRIHSADRIVAEWQNIAVGDEVRLYPGVGLAVAELQTEQALVLRGAVPMGATSPYDFTWAFVLRPVSESVTRLVVRERYSYTRRWAALVVEPVEVISFVMSERMLRGIRQRAESETH